MHGLGAGNGGQQEYSFGFRELRLYSMVLALTPRRRHHRRLLSVVRKIVKFEERKKVEGKRMEKSVPRNGDKVN